MVLLDVQNLTTHYITLRGPVKAAENVSFQIEKGEALGLVGESGCGKTTVALSILKILPPGGKIINGKIFFDSINLVELDENQMRKNIRWTKISLVFQGAMNALNPVYKVKDQIVEVIRLHEPNVTKQEAEERARRLIALVGIDPSRVESYPHELSGGMKQRAVIAMALANNPEMLIADEPATALDVIVQAQVLQLIKELRRKLNLSMMMITHDLSMVAETCEKIVVMYAGKVAEYGDIVKVFEEPLHPYTQALIASFPNIRRPKSRLYSLAGSPPDLLNPPKGCRFHPRCKFAMDICRKKDPPCLEVGKSLHYVACHLVHKI